MANELRQQLKKLPSDETVGITYEQFADISETILRLLEEAVVDPKFTAVRGTLHRCCNWCTSPLVALGFERWRVEANSERTTWRAYKLMFDTYKSSTKLSYNEKKVDIRQRALTR